MAQPFAIERFLPFRLSVLSNRLTRVMARIYFRRFHLSAPEWRTMAVLGRYGPISANGVVEHTAMDKVRVSRAVARLVSGGNITRRVDPLDRRRAVLEITPQGYGIYQQVVTLLREVETEMLAGVGANERAALDRVLTTLEAHAMTMLQRTGREAPVEN